LWSCTPCRAGNQLIYTKIKKLGQGICTSQDLIEIAEWGAIMKKASRCGLGQYSTNTIIQAISKFDNFFKEIVSADANNNNVEFDMEKAVREYNLLIKNTQN